ncbi:MAG: isoprenoid biosynthesis glyoxalase ElbB [Bacteroidales bacterium]|jgi:enhancing lycopene biosynthesis protein 2|nr:isoprenoid biosynthesis glyoxalase ElbB [Bacteroidales bacterium]
MKKFAIVLSGCGVYDGAEIHEATMAMLAISKRGHQYQVFAPNIPQHHVVNHITGEEMPEKRNVLVESARIARGNIEDLTNFDASQYDILLFAGGFGAAKNLSDFAFKGDGYTVIQEVSKAIREMHNAGKPVGAMCVSPILIADVLKGVELTLGSPCGASDAAEKKGAIHHTTSHCEVTVDKKHKIATTPCYMLDANISQVAEGADNLVEELLKLV